MARPRRAASAAAAEAMRRLEAQRRADAADVSSGSDEAASEPESASESESESETSSVSESEVSAQSASESSESGSDSAMRSPKKAGGRVYRSASAASQTNMFVKLRPWRPVPCRVHSLDEWRANAAAAGRYARGKVNKTRRDPRLRRPPADLLDVAELHLPVVASVLPAIMRWPAACLQVSERSRLSYQPLEIARRHAPQTSAACGCVGSVAFSPCGSVLYATVSFAPPNVYPTDSASALADWREWSKGDTGSALNTDAESGHSAAAKPGAKLPRKAAASNAIGSATGQLPIHSASAEEPPRLVVYGSERPAELETWRAVAEVKGESFPSTDWDPTALSVSPDGQTLSVIQRSGQMVLLWISDFSHLLLPRRDYTACDFADGETLVAGCAGGHVRVYRVDHVRRHVTEAGAAPKLAGPRLDAPSGRPVAAVAARRGLGAVAVAAWDSPPVLMDWTGACVLPRSVGLHASLGPVPLVAWAPMLHGVVCADCELGGALHGPDGQKRTHLGFMHVHATAIAASALHSGLALGTAHGHLLLCWVQGDEVVVAKDAAAIAEDGLRLLDEDHWPAPGGESDAGFRLLAAVRAAAWSPVHPGVLALAGGDAFHLVCLDTLFLAVDT